MYCLEYSVKIPITIDKCWDFFSNPANLKTLTPAHLGFKITSKHAEEKMYPGQIITYTIYPVAGIPVHWVTEITQVQKPFYFIDEQRFGPYACWHHEHRFVSIEGGVEMKDIIYYKMPFGPLGKLIHALKVKKDLENIFAYRKIKLESLFGHFQQPS